MNNSALFCAGRDGDSCDATHTWQVGLPTNATMTCALGLTCVNSRCFREPETSVNQVGTFTCVDQDPEPVTPLTVAQITALAPKVGAAQAQVVTRNFSTCTCRASGAIDHTVAKGKDADDNDITGDYAGACTVCRGLHCPSLRLTGSGFAFSNEGGDELSANGVYSLAPETSCTVQPVRREGCCCGTTCCKT